MRKALIGILVAATAITPLTSALAQQRGEWRSGSEVEEQATARAESRAQARAAHRTERAQPAPQSRERSGGERGEERAQQRSSGQWGAQQRQPAAQQQAAPVAHQQARGATPVAQQSNVDRNWQGDRNNPRHERARERYNRLEQQHQAGQQRQAEQQRQQDRGRYDQRRQQTQAPQNRRDVRDQWQAQQRADQRARWNRDWRNHQRYDWRNYRHVNRHLYRMPAYYAPYRGHRYSRFSIGLFIGAPLFHQRYWISDPWQYRLPYAPAGYQWVRYYDDVLLVDTWTGEVVDVIYDFFW